MTYAAVPFYRAFCSATGFGGTPITKGTGADGAGEGRFEASRLVPTQFAGGKTDDRIRVTFNSDTSDSLPWSFTPVTKEIHVLPGETALAFFAAKNTGKRDIVGIATYNVAPDRVSADRGHRSHLPMRFLRRHTHSHTCLRSTLSPPVSQIAPYFAKVECFCFEEQKLLAGEEVDLPVFFFIDRDMLDDPTVKDVREVVLSYTFFSARRNERSGQLEPDTDLSKYTVGMDLPGVK